MNELSSLLPGFLRQLHFSEELTAELVIALWKNVVGETLAQNARPLRMRGSTLVLTVLGSVEEGIAFALRDSEASGKTRPSIISGPGRWILMTAVSAPAVERLPAILPKSLQGWS